MADTPVVNENEEHVHMKFVERDEDLVDIQVATNPSALVVENNDGYQNITNRQDVKERLTALGLSWDQFVLELNKLPSIEDFTDITENKINEIIGTLMVQQQEKDDLAIANALNTELNPEEDEKRDHV